MAPPSPSNAGSEAPPQVLGAVHRFFETSLYLMLLTSLLTVISTGKLDPATSVAALLALLAKGWRWRRGMPPELSEAAAKRWTIAYLIFFPVDFLFISMALAEGSQNQPLFAALLAVIHLLVFAMIVRLYSARATRDHLFLAMVAFAMVLVSAILTIDTAFLLFLVFFLLLCISTFMGLEMRRSAEGAVSPPLATGTPAAHRLHRALGLTTAGLSVGAVLFAGFIFLLLPRITAGFLSSYNFQPTVLSGFSDAESQLGQIGSIKLNPAVVMRVKQITGKIGPEYWRGSALTNFDGSRWFTPPHSTRVVELRGSDDPTAWSHLWWEGLDLGTFDRERYQQMWETRRRLKATDTQVSYRVFLEPIGSDKIFMATQGTAVRGTFAPGTARLNQRRRGFLNVDVANSVSNPAHNYSRLVYDAQSVKMSFPAALLREAGTELPPSIPKWYLQLPHLDPRIQQLTEQITAGAPTQYDKVIAVQRHLLTRYVYSLEMNGQSLAGFLFDRKAGHCEYFATAMAIMLRTVGIPTRYARGFLGGEYNDVGDNWIVRARDAHSWVEVYFPDIGWVTFDPTPPAPTGLRGFLHRLGLYWDAAELMWINWVVNYNFQQQDALGRNLQRQSARWSTRTYAWLRGNYDQTVWAMGRFRRELIRLARDAPLAMAMLFLSVAGGILYLLKRRALLEWLAVRFGVRLRKEQQSQLVTLYYQQMLRLLAKRGWKKTPGQTPREFATTLCALPEAAPIVPPVQAVTSIFEAARYGSAAVDFPQLAAQLEALRRSHPLTPPRRCATSC